MQIIYKKCRSFIKSEGCLYRGPNGTKCAVGALIPDELYKEEIEGWNINRFYLGKCPKAGKYSAIVQHFSGITTPMLYLLQEVHDDEDNWDINGLNGKGVRRLFSIAKGYNLSDKLVRKLFC